MIKRHIEEKLKQYLKIFPVVLLTGARQVGKTTFIKKLIKPNGYHYVTFDDANILFSAKEDPIGFLKNQPKPLIIDEVQRACEIFLPIKQIVDEEKKPGQFILIGSANPLLMPKLGDSLAGRMGNLSMFPFSQGELFSKKENFLSWIFSKDFRRKNFSRIDSFKIADIIFKGGFPKIHDFSNTSDIEIWLQEYINTIINRDIKDISQIEGFYSFPNLFKLLANRSASLFNGADIARNLKISTASVHRYIALLESIFFVFRTLAWFCNNTKRIMKSPKIYVLDTGILSYLLKAGKNILQKDPSVFGFLFESFVMAEILKQMSWSQERVESFHYREGSKEVDIVLEKENNIVGIEVKSSETIKSFDFNGLKRLKNIAGKRFIRGIVLYRGSHFLSFSENFWAVPVNALWES